MNKNKKKLKISIYGLGNFGYAFLKHFDRKKNEIRLVGFDQNKKILNALKKHHRHPYLHKEYQVSNKVIFTGNQKDLINKSDVLILAVPSDATREVARKIKKYIGPNLIIVNTAKALDFKTGKPLSRILKQELKGKNYHYALLAGGTIASDLFKHEPLGATIACPNKNLLPFLVKTFESSNLRVYPTTDLIGVEYASAFKNAVAILAGIIKGMGFSYGSETHLISLVASEIEKIVTTKLGGEKETFSMKSQAWGNDLWMSCTGSTRNREFGILLGKGTPVKKALILAKKQHRTIEGINTIRVLNKIVRLKNYPLLNFLYQFIATKKVDLKKLRKLIFSNKI